jgi:cyclic dehypoxanthinyl futalosine synthase
MTNFDRIKKFGDDPEINEILSRALCNELLDIEDGIKILKSNNLNLLGAAADTLRKRSAGELVTFVIDRNINYTNVCTSKCKFCAFYREVEAKDAYVLSMRYLRKLMKL